MPRPVYLERQHDALADFVIYHRGHDPACCVWMVPNTQVDVAGPRYRSRALASAADFSQSRMHRREMEIRADAARQRVLQRKGRDDADE